ncbi:MAG: hypothetical protein OQK35_03005 [Alphaproteobacteria bacterium]|nr:hypothetical protein [Alphaproteobacteria bacterium]
MTFTGKIIAITGTVLVASLIANSPLQAAGPDPFDPNALSPTAPPVLGHAPTAPVAAPAPMVTPDIPQLTPQVAPPVIETPKIALPPKPVPAPAKLAKPAVEPANKPGIFSNLKDGLTDFFSNKSEPEESAPVKIETKIKPVVEPKIEPIIEAAPVKTEEKPVEVKVEQPKPVETKIVAPELKPDLPKNLATISAPTKEEPGFFSLLGNKIANLFTLEKPKPAKVALKIPEAKKVDVKVEPVKKVLKQAEPTIVEEKPEPLVSVEVNKPEPIEVKPELIGIEPEPVPESPKGTEPKAVASKEVEDKPGFLSKLQDILKEEPSKPNSVVAAPEKTAEVVPEKIDAKPAPVELKTVQPKTPTKKAEPLRAKPQLSVPSEPLKIAPTERLTTLEQLKAEKEVVEELPAPQEQPGLLSKLSEGIKDILNEEPDAPAQKKLDSESTKPLVTEKASPFHPEAPSPTIPQPRFTEKPVAPSITEPTVEELNPSPKAASNPAEEPSRIVSVERETPTEPTPGFFDRMKNRITNLFSPPSMETLIATDEAEKETGNKSDGEPPAAPVLTKADFSQLASLPPATESVIEASPAFMAAKIGLGTNLLLGETIQNILGKQKPVCVAKAKKTKHYCMVKANWDGYLRPHFNISNVVYRGAKGLIQFDGEVATRLYTLFPRGSYITLLAHYTKLYGSPSLSSERKVRTLLKGNNISKIAQWRRQNPDTKEISVFELREIDDIRSNFPDLEYGVLRVYIEGTTEIFSVVSTLDFFDMD